MIYVAFEIYVTSSQIFSIGCVSVTQCHSFSSKKNTQTLFFYSYLDMTYPRYDWYIPTSNILWGVSGDLYLDTD